MKRRRTFQAEETSYLQALRQGVAQTMTRATHCRMGPGGGCQWWETLQESLLVRSQGTGRGWGAGGAFCTEQQKPFQVLGVVDKILFAFQKISWLHREYGG